MEGRFAEYREVMAKIKEVWEKEEKYWYQRSRVKWMEFGDKNTRYFHQVTRQRRQINKVVRIKERDGEWIEEKEMVRGRFEDYYKELFCTRGGRRWGRVLEYVPKVVNEDVNKELVREVEEDEIKNAVFQLGTFKAPGPDGFNGLFYQKFWEVVNKDVKEAVKSFFINGRMLKELNATEIVLIPKVKGPEEVTQFRPISLCNFAYKVISKIMVNRMQERMGEIITENQSAFLAGRQIQDNILVAQEVFHFLKMKKRGKKSYMAMKVDMNKAYDRVEWDFLEAVMLKLGFEKKWVDWIMECVKTVSYNLVINGKPSNRIYPTRGLRQGDPLSPYLFLIVSDVLSRMVLAEIKSQEVKGMVMNKYCPILSHLFFADDSLFFMEAEESNCQKMMGIIKDYELASGQKINLDKSSMVFSTNAGEELRRRIADCVGMTVAANPGTYLGIPSMWGRTKVNVMNFLKERVQGKLQHWKQQALSQGGKEILIKAVACAIPTYIMGCFKVPKKVCEEMNKEVANFWWGQKEKERRIHWKSWKCMTKSKSEGGMGFKDLIVFNNALLAKQGWRLLQQKEALWARVLKGLYFPHCSFLDAKKRGQSFLVLK